MADEAVLQALSGAAPGTDPEFAGVVAQRTDADNAYLDKLEGRVVARYFGGYGTFVGVVGKRVPGRPVVVADYDDGDSEELYLDQAIAALMPKGTPPSHPYTQEEASKYGYTWPPPTVSTRYLVETRALLLSRREENGEEREEHVETQKKKIE